MSGYGAIGDLFQLKLVAGHFAREPHPALLRLTDVSCGCGLRVWVVGVDEKGKERDERGIVETERKWRGQGNGRGGETNANVLQFGTDKNTRKYIVELKELGTTEEK